MTHLTLEHQAYDEGHLANGGALTMRIRTETCACGAVEQTTSPNWKRCRVCAKKHQRKQQAEYMRKQRGKGRG